MGEQRTNLFAGDDVLDLAEFKPKKPARQGLAVAKQAAAATGFVSREAKAAPAPVALVKPVQRRRRTGRNAQINLKATPETIAEFCAISDAQGWVFGETLEKAVELLRAKYGAKGQ
ncbi:stability/partitioning determinant [Mesorhizobium sp. M0478]|uniref:stability/partitioning determinant n=1 Tax=Mesorhizobium sp. M0478 TaxID=2956947 RepID=UPI0033383141